MPRDSGGTCNATLARVVDKRAEATPPAFCGYVAFNSRLRREPKQALALMRGCKVRKRSQEHTIVRVHSVTWKRTIGNEA